MSENMRENMSADWNEESLLIQSRVKAIEAELRSISDKARLLPVTKTQSVEKIMALKGAGITAIGENRVQEMMEKYPVLGSDFSFHIIGRLQSNKIKYIIGRVCMIQSLDRMSLAQEIDRRAQMAGIRMPVLVEVNVGGESQKGGIAPEETREWIRQAAQLKGLEIKGLMTVMPAAEDPQSIRPLFRQMKTLFTQVQQDGIEGVDMQELSMGMSGDWRVAAEEGATLVRIGSAIFGAR